ncbi:MAG: hypothetical protein KDA68_00375 [Planctomycetaceae bacterium]|nr:hypothetical protein [Planctomycetaceae bacterium]
MSQFLMQTTTFVNDLAATPVWTSLGWTMWYYLWIGLIELAFAGLMLAFFRRASSALRYRFLLGLFAVLLVTPIIIFQYAYRETNAPLPSAPIVSTRPTVQWAPSTSTPALPPQDFVEPDRMPNALQPPWKPGFEVRVPNPSPHPVQPSLEILRTSPESNGFSPFHFQRLATFVPWLPILWIIGSPLTLLCLGFGLIGAERFRRQARIISSGSIVDQCAQLAARIGLNGRILIGFSERITSPILIGILKPLILLPITAETGWTPAQLEMVLLHELAHVRRWDNLVNLLQRLAEGILFFQPAVWIVSRWLTAEREHCCDELVVRVTGRAHDYATALAQLAMSEHLPPGVVSAMARHPLLGRIRRILGHEQPLQVSRTTLTIALIISLSCCALAGLTHGLENKPTAQVEPENTPSETVSAQTAVPSSEPKPNQNPTNESASDSSSKFSLEQRVTDRSNKPISGAKVTLFTKDPRSSSGRNILFEGESDPTGAISISCTIPDDSKTWIELRKPGYAIHRAKLSVVRGTLHSGQFLKMVPGANVRFRVIDPSGQPLPGAILAITSSGYFPYMNVIADAEGFVSLQDLPAGMIGVSYLFGTKATSDSPTVSDSSLEGYADYFEGEQLETFKKLRDRIVLYNVTFMKQFWLAPEKTSEKTIDLRECWSKFEGTVVDRNGTAISGERVLILAYRSDLPLNDRLQSGSGHPVGISLDTDDQGRFTLYGINEGKYSFSLKNYPRDSISFYIDGRQDYSERIVVRGNSQSSGNPPFEPLRDSNKNVVYGKYGKWIRIDSGEIPVREVLFKVSGMNPDSKDPVKVTINPLDTSSGQDMDSANLPIDQLIKPDPQGILKIPVPERRCLITSSMGQHLVGPPIALQPLKFENRDPLPLVLKPKIPLWIRAVNPDVDSELTVHFHRVHKAIVYDKFPFSTHIGGESKIRLNQPVVVPFADPAYTGNYLRPYETLIVRYPEKSPEEKVQWNGFGDFIEPGKYAPSRKRKPGYPRILKSTLQDLPIIGKSWVDLVESTDGETEKEIVLDFTTCICKVRGTVKDERGRPIAGAEIQVNRHFPARWDSQDPRLFPERPVWEIPVPVWDKIPVSDAEGKFVLENHQPGLVAIYALLDDEHSTNPIFAELSPDKPAEANFIIAQDPSPTLQKVPPPAPETPKKVTGKSSSQTPSDPTPTSPGSFQKCWQIVDVAGKPIPGVQIEADGVIGKLDNDGWGSGSFSSSGKYNFTLTKPGFLPVSLHLNGGNFFRSYQNLTPLAEQTKIEMMRCSTLDVTVLDVDGKPVPNYRLSVSNRFFTDVLERNSKHFQVLTDERGRAVVINLREGLVSLRPSQGDRSDASRASWVKTLPIADGSRQSITLSLSDFSSILEGTILSETGSEPAGPTTLRLESRLNLKDELEKLDPESARRIAKIMLRRVSLAQLTGEEGSATEFCCSMVSQQDGRFRIQGLLPGEYIVSIPRRVSMAKIPTIPTTDHQPFLSFDLPSEWKDPNADLIAFDPHPVTLKPHETTQLKIVAKPPATTPPPVKLQPVVDPNLLHEDLRDLGAGNPPDISKSLPPNPQTPEIAPKVTVQGIVLDQNGDPLRGAQARLYIPKWNTNDEKELARTVTDVAGIYRFSWDRLEIGNKQIEIVCPGYVAQEKPADLMVTFPKSEHTIFHMEKGASAKITVLGEGERPIANALVRIVTHEGYRNHYELTDADGNILLKDYPPGFADVIYPCWLPNSRSPDELERGESFLRKHLAGRFKSFAEHTPVTNVQFMDEIILESDKTVVSTIQLSNCRSKLSGQVVNESGIPIAKSALILFRVRNGTPLAPDPIQHGHTSGFTQLIADDAGKFEFPRLNPGEYFLQCRDSEGNHHQKWPQHVAIRSDEDHVETLVMQSNTDFESNADLPVSQISNFPQPTPREQLRYDGKSFGEWKNILRTDIKTERIIEAIEVMLYFGSKGYQSEAASEVVAALRRISPVQEIRERTSSALILSKALITLNLLGKDSVPYLAEILRDQDDSQVIIGLEFLSRVSFEARNWPDKLPEPTSEWQVVPSSFGENQELLVRFPPWWFSPEIGKELSRLLKHPNPEIRARLTPVALRCHALEELPELLNESFTDLAPAVWFNSLVFLETYKSLLQVSPNYLREIFRKLKEEGKFKGDPLRHNLYLRSILNDLSDTPPEETIQYIPDILEDLKVTKNEKHSVIFHLIQASTEDSAVRKQEFSDALEKAVSELPGDEKNRVDEALKRLRPEFERIFK